MTDWLPCLYAAILISSTGLIFAVIGYYVGRWREQMWLLEVCQPEH
jgi:hypothetical protein